MFSRFPNMALNKGKFEPWPDHHHPLSAKHVKACAVIEQGAAAFGNVLNSNFR